MQEIAKCALCGKEPRVNNCKYTPEPTCQCYECGVSCNSIETWNSVQAALLAEKELVELKAAASAVIAFWTDSKAIFAEEEVAMPIGVSVDAVQVEQWVDIKAETLDKLERLCGGGE